jgi:phosphatidylserine/phosphatidylglycerophosphate/cardiolipin synthase-like enzyme
MRKRAKSGALTVHAVAGARVVMLGMDLDQSATKRLMGFAVKRFSEDEGSSGFLPNFLLFEANDEGAASDHSSWLNPMQTFQWTDYAALPGRSYVYSVTAMYGKPGKLKPGDSVDVAVTTEGGPDAVHSVYFNRGASGWQAYEREFGELDPDQVPDRAAYRWLSRGLEEELLAFIAQAEGKGWGLRVAIYEFSAMSVLDALWSAKRRGVDVKVVVDERTTVTSPTKENEAAIEVADLPDSSLRPRTKTPYIPHNKFMVLLKDGKAQQVLLGSTNITKGGIFGQSNLAHLIRDEAAAAAFLDYWNQLGGDPTPSELKKWTVDKGRDLPEQRLGAEGDQLLPPPDSITPVFSPRPSVDALKWYAQLMAQAKECAFLTGPFGISAEMQEVFEEDRTYLRFLMLDKEDKRIRLSTESIERDADNRVAAGAYLGSGAWHQWLKEHLTGFNKAVNFLHTKFMLVDALSEDPIVVTGSANFSEPSVNHNDEHMVVIRGDTAVADVYLVEFMRLFNAFRLRGRVNAKAGQKAPAPDTVSDASGNLYLHDDDAWVAPFYDAGTPKSSERLLFSGSWPR